MNQDNDPKKQQPFNFNPNTNRFALIFLIILIVLFAVSIFFSSGNIGTEIPYSAFISYLEEGKIISVTIIDQFEIHGTYEGRANDRSFFTTKIPYYDPELISILKSKGVTVKGDVKGVSPLRVIMETIPWILIFGFTWFMFRQMQSGGNKAFSFGKSKARPYDKGKKVTFADVAGQKEAKHELEEVVEFLKNPARFTKIGARIPKGVLLVGMPGTGKTLLARAVAGEAGVSFFHMSGSDFVEMFVGVGAARVRDLFEQARKSSPCIIFIDELDAVGRVRGAGYGGGHDEREQTLNQLLVEMDGFESKEGIIVLAATNRPDVLDPALLRPGRFDRQVVVDMPDIKEREAILKIHARKIPLGDDVDFDRLARGTAGSSGADLENMVNEAALLAARKHKEKVEMEDFEEARDKVIMGVARKSRVLSKEEKEKTAYHESGHALLHFFLENADPLHKVTIIPRGRALGMAVSLPEKDEYSKGKNWLLDRIRIAFGGYAAEKIVYNETTTGTQQDIRYATDLARRMVCEWGMSDELGPVALGQEDEPIFIGKEIARHKDYSEETAKRIDDAIHKLLKDALDEVFKLLSDNRDKLDALAKALVERETLTESDICELLNIKPKRLASEA